MAAQTLDLYVEQGATFTLEFTWREPDTVDETGTVTAVGAPHNLTGWDARMQFRPAQGATALLSASVATGEFAIDGPNGKVSLKLTDEQTDTLNRAKLLYDIELEDTAGNVYRMLQGKVTVSPNITQLPTDPVVTA